MSQPYRDLFSRDPSAYAEYRPRYPEELFRWLASLPSRQALAWDAGTGNGQAAAALAAWFDRVVATDASANQLSQAIAHPRVEYRVAREEAALAPHSVDLVTVAQALHWFDRPQFWKEVERVLGPGGVVAVWCYELQQVTPAIDAVITHFYRDVVGQYWTPERKLVETGYRGVEFPFTELTPPRFSMTAMWTLEQELGYVGTWSAVGRARRATGCDPVEQLIPQLEAVWPPGARLRIEWPLSVRAGRPETANLSRT
jgi:SAM-dependent methyltransferase